MRIWCIILFYGMGFRYELTSPTGKIIDPEKNMCLFLNHTSIMDIMLMCILHPKHPICFVGKKELVKIPIFGTIYKRVCVMVDRKSMKSRTDVYRRCAERMNDGQNIVIYPEGGVRMTLLLYWMSLKTEHLPYHLNIIFQLLYIHLSG